MLVDARVCDGGGGGDGYLSVGACARMCVHANPVVVVAAAAAAEVAAGAVVVMVAEMTSRTILVGDGEWLQGWVYVYTNRDLG